MRASFRENREQFSKSGIDLQAEPYFHRFWPFQALPGVKKVLIKKIRDFWGSTRCYKNLVLKCFWQLAIYFRLSTDIHFKHRFLDKWFVRGSPRAYIPFWHWKLMYRTFTTTKLFWNMIIMMIKGIYLRDSWIWWLWTERK